MEIHHIHVIRGKNKINKLNPDKIKIVAIEDERSRNIYSGKVNAIIHLEDIRIGDTLDYSYSIVGKNPVFSNEFTFFVDLGWQVSVDKLHFRILMPSHRKLNYKKFNTSYDPIVNVTAAKTEYKIEISNTKGVIVDGDSPSWFNPYPLIQFSKFNEWRQVADWAVDLFSVKEPLNNEFKQFIEELNNMEQQAAIQKAIAFVQDDIRYLGLEISHNSHKPHHPNTVFKNRYGDCKDKSLLLVTLLNKIGVQAYPALVSTDNKFTINQYLTTPDLFNHAITNIVWQGNEFWIDPTRTYQSKTLESIHQPDYGLALLVKAGTHELTTATPTKSVKSSVNIQEKFWSVDYTSPVEWQIKSHYTGE